jgi:putative transposase
MSHTKIWIHSVWGTKGRVSILKPHILPLVCNHIVENAEKKGIHIDRINGYDDHIHVLMLLNPECSISRQMQLLKGESSIWANRSNILRDGLYWAEDYFASSVSEVKLDTVRAYIENQQAHHRKITYVDELNFFLKSLGLQEEGK